MRPWRQTFSSVMTTANAAIQARSMIPRAISATISDQQHPTQYAPWYMPDRTWRSRPR